MWPARAGRLDEMLCEHHERRVGHDNCVRFQGRGLQIPPDRYRCHDVKANVTVLHHPDGWLAIRHGPRELARYDVSGKPLKEDSKAAGVGSAATASALRELPGE